MKRLIQVGMVAVALLVGAQAAQAAPIAQFSWDEDSFFDTTTLTFTNLSGGLITGLVVTPTPYQDPLMTLTTLIDFDPLDPLDGDQSFNFFNYSAGTLTSVTVAFYYVDASLVRWSFFRSYDADPTGGPVSEVIDSSLGAAVVPEPASLSLLCLGLATAAAVRRRRN